MRPPRKLCVHMYVCACKNIFSFKGKVQEKLEGLGPPFSFPQGNYSLRMNKMMEKYSMCNWALLPGHDFLSSPYI